ncbi:SGNH/GDSL hydrolase family protein [Pantanalinema rosaneae CENA516]
MVVLVNSIQSSPTIDALYVFGDSLSDTGTVFRATGGLYPPNPPYFQGRYSNGRVWVEYLADRLQISSKQLNNFAYGGATTAESAPHFSNGSSESSLAPGLLTQVQSILPTQVQIEPQALTIIWAGANDYLQGVSQATVPVANITRAMEVLMAKGAKRFLVANLPDLGQLPAIRTSANSDRLSQLTQAHNQGLRRSLKQLHQQYRDIQIVTLDANTLYREAITDPDAFGFTNVINACLTNSRSCGQPEQFLFWDGIHPTTTAHRFLGEAAFSEIQAARMAHPPLAGSPAIDYQAS